MAYGYYTDPGTSFGNTGQTQEQQNETFIQRQQRLQASQTPSTGATTSGAFQPVAGARTGQNTTPAPAPTGGSTPVMGNGSIPPPAPPAPAPATAAPAPAPAPPPAPAPAPQVATPGEQYSVAEAYAQNLGWVPPDHPAFGTPGYVGWKKAPGTAPAAAATGGAATTGTPGSALGGPAEAAKSGMFTQFAAPEHDFQNWQQLELVSKILANPETMTPELLNKMKQASMEEQLAMKQQLQQQVGEELGASGFSTNGGRMAASNRALDENILNAILGQNRQFEIQASQQNRQDLLQALGVSEAILGGQVGRAGSVYGNILAGQGANRDDYWTGQNLDLQRELGRAGINIDQQRVGLEGRRIDEGARQFDAGHGLNILQLLEGSRQADNNLGFNYTQLGANQQQNMIDAILGRR